MVDYFFINCVDFSLLYSSTLILETNELFFNIRKSQSVEVISNLYLKMFSCVVAKIHNLGKGPVFTILLNILTRLLPEPHSYIK